MDDSDVSQNALLFNLFKSKSLNVTPVVEEASSVLTCLRLLYGFSLQTTAAGKYLEETVRHTEDQRGHLT